VVVTVKKVGLGLGGVVLLAGTCALLYAAHVVRSLNTPGFKAQVTQKASEFAGAPVSVESLDVSLLRGIRLAGIHLQNPPGFKGDLLAVDETRLNYSLWPLLRGRIQVDELTLRNPVITLATNARGLSNYERLGAVTPAPRPAISPTAASTILPGLVVSKLSVENARFAMVDGNGVAALRLEGAALDSALAVESGLMTGTGSARVESAILANALFLRDIRAPLALTKERLSLTPLQAKLAGGQVSGEIEAEFKRQMRFALQIEVNGASVATLLKEAGSAGTLEGLLGAEARVEGTGGLPTLKGDGHAQIKNCRWPKAALFGALSSILQIPELANPRFDDCRVEFTLGNGQARTPVVNFTGPALELTGRGVANLASSVLNYDLTLALSPGLLAKVPGAMRAAFKTRPDGFGTIAFKVTGTTADPKTDLASRFGKSLAIEAVKEGLLGGLLGGKK